MPKKKSFRTIGEDTAIMPDLIAEAVVEIANRLLGGSSPDGVFDERDIGIYIGRLAEQAETLYASNTDFRKKIRSNANHGNAGRDYLYAFMQHWLASRLLKDSGNRPEWHRALVDSGFSVGSPVLLVQGMATPIH